MALEKVQHIRQIELMDMLPQANIPWLRVVILSEEMNAALRGAVEALGGEEQLLQLLEYLRDPARERG